MLPGQANRGRALEELICRANAAYRARGLAVIHKVPTAWLPIRDNRGRVVSAKVEEKAVVDFMGLVKTPGGPLPLAFDAKEISKGNRWPLSRLEEHQFGFLRDFAACDGLSFILLGFWEFQEFYALPFPELARRRAAWQAGNGPAFMEAGNGAASVKAGEDGLIRITFPDYLAWAWAGAGGKKPRRITFPDFFAWAERGEKRDRPGPLLQQ